MDLRRRTLLVLALSLAGLAVALYFTMSSTVFGGLASYETADATKAAGAVRQNALARLGELSDDASRYAGRSAMASFVGDHDISQLQRQIPAAQLQESGYKFALILNQNGTPIAGYYDSLASWGTKGWTGEIRAQLSGKGWPDFSKPRANAEDYRGILRLEDTQLLITSGAIKFPGGRNRGTLLLGQKFTPSLLLSKQVSENVSDIVSGFVMQRGTPGDLHSITEKSTLQSPVQTSTLNQSVVAGYFLLPSQTPGDKYAVRVEVPRRVVQTGRIFAARALIVLVVCVLLCGSLLWVILDRQVLARIEQLSAGVANVGARADPSLRLRLAGDDEVAKLSMSINQMLGDLERSQADLKESEQRFSALAAASFEAIMIHDGVRIVEVNQALLDMFGYERNELIGAEIEKLAPRWVPDSIWARVSDAGDEAIEANGATRSGSTVPLEVRCRKMPYRGQNFSVAAMRDITERRKAEAALRESEERYRRLVDLAQEGIVSNDANEVITFCNPTFASVLGYTPQQLQGRSLIELCTPQSAERMLQEASKRRSGLSGTYEVELISRDNRARAFHLTARPMFDEEGGYEGSLGVFTDITERKQTEQAWLAAQKAESLGVLAGGLAHDFNNLLVGIIGNVSLALDTIPPASPVMKYLAEIDRASQRASELVEQMLAYSGKGRLALRKVDLNNVIEETIRLMGTSVPKHVQVELDLARPLATIDADEGLMRQMISSFILNSIEAIKEENGQIRITTGVIDLNEESLRGIAPSTDLEPGHFIFLTVTDNGGGMESSIRDRVFDPFFSTKFAGRGLGLAAVQGIVRRHRGAIQVESEPGRGSAFRVILPISAPMGSGSVLGTREERSSRGRDSEGSGRSAGSGADSGSGRTEGRSEPSQAARTVHTAVLEQAEELAANSTPAALKVLVVAQEATVRQVTRRILEQRGYSVELVVNGNMALKNYAEHSAEYGLVLLDLDLRDLSGPEVLNRLREINPDLHAVLITGDLEVPAEIGSVAVLRKPFSPVQLLQKIESAI